MRKYKYTITAILIIAAVLTAAFFLGGDNELSSLFRSVTTGSGETALLEVEAQGNTEPGSQDNEPVGTADGADGHSTAVNGTVSGDGLTVTQDDAGLGDPGFAQNTDGSGFAGGDEPDSPSIGTTPYNPQSGGLIASETPDTGTPGDNSKPVGNPPPAAHDNAAAPPSGDTQQDLGAQQTESAQPPGSQADDMTVTLIISVASLLGNMDKLPDGKAGLIPADGIIFSGKVVFYEGESVFNVLQRETKKNKIHMEFTNTPIYNSAYIEGIGNIYEFDAGERSGWIYKVNEFFPNYGCSRYIVETGDVIQWLYTCDRGADVGGASAADSYNWG